VKVKFRIFTVILAIFIISPFYLTFVDAEEDLYNEEITQPCPHNTLYNFDEENKTLNGVYEGNRVEALLSDIAFVGDKAVVLYNGETVTEGELQIGMLVQIYHNDTLFGEYVIQELLEPFPEVPAPMQENTSSSISTQTNVSTLSAGNAYGFILPLDGMNLTSNISQYFGGEHRGIDISWGGINGTPIRAVKAGTVDATNIDWTYGNHIRIDHGNGQKTLYAHMKYTPLVSSGENVAQGQIIGYVGNTGNVYPEPTESNPTAGTHLHFEVTVNGTLKNPIIYLTGAPTYGGSTHSHNYQYFYEGNHPHREYMECSCGDVYLLGTNAATYTNVNYEASHPHRIYGTCTCCNTVQYTGETKNLYTYYYEGNHPHREYMECSCGDVYLLGTNAATYTNVNYEASHPHRIYGTCTCCNTVQYTGETENLYKYYYEGNHPHREYMECSCGDVYLLGTNAATYTNVNYEAAHPHKIYGTCTCCNTVQYTGEIKDYVSSCTQCNT